MRVLHTADWHLGKNLEGYSRMEEQELFLEDFVRIADENKADLVVIAGDVFDSGNPPSKAESMFYGTLKQLSKGGERIVLVIAGNHDNPERLVAAGPLAREHGIIMVGTQKTIVEPGQYGAHQVVASDLGFFELHMKGEKAVILTVPFPSEKRLNELLFGEEGDEKESAVLYGERVKDLFQRFSVHFRPDTINMIATHLFSMNSEEGGSERSIQLGGSYIFDGRDFPKDAQYIALGHIHKPQVVPGTEKRARYSGSPIHYSKREAAFEKKCILAELRPGREAEITEIPIPAYKPIETWKCVNVEEAMELCRQNQDRKCWVYIEIQSQEFIQEDDIKKLKGLKADIIEITTTRRGEYEEQSEDVLSLPFKEMFGEFYKKERGTSPEAEVMELLLSIVSEVEEHEAD